MEPEIENKYDEMDSLTLHSNYFPVGQDSLGLATINQYIYVFYAQKIQVYEQLSGSLTPELVQEIYLPKQRIKNFAVSQQFIAVLFTDHGLEVRLREYWQVVQFSTSLSQQINISDIRISAKKLIYCSEVSSQLQASQLNSNAHSYSFIDICGKQGIKTWDNPINVQKLIHRSKLNSISDFYLTLHENKMKFGMFYNDQDKFKSYQLGELPSQTQQILDVQLIEQKQSQSNEIKEGDKERDKYEKCCVFLLEVIKGEAISPSSGFKLKYGKFYEYSVIQRNQGNHQDQMYQVYEDMLQFLNKMGENCRLSGQEAFKYQKQIVLKADLDEQFEKMQFNSEKSLLYISLSNTIYEFLLKDSEILLQRSLKKNRKETLMHIGENFGIFTCQKWSTSSFSNPKSSDSGNHENHESHESHNNHENHDNYKDQKLDQQQNQQQQHNKETSGQPEIKNIEEQVQTDALDQFDEKYMNQIIDRLFQKKQVSDQGIQTEPIDINLDPVDDTDEKQIISSNDDQQIMEPEKQEKQTVIQIIREREIIKYFPNLLHEQQVKKLGSVISSLTQSIEIAFSSQISQLLKNQHLKLKEQCLSSLKKICQEQISNTILPKIEQMLTEIFGNKLHEINEYVYSLSIQNLLNLRDQFEKDKINERMLQNQLMKQQVQEIQEFKKSVSKMLEICKVRECQKMAFFLEIKHKFSEIEQRVNTLQNKVNDILTTEDQNQTEITQQIEAIRNLIELKHPKKSKKYECSEGSSCQEGNSDSDKDSVSSEQAESDNRKIDCSSSQDNFEQFDEYPVVPYSLGPVNPIQRNYRQEMPRTVPPMHHPMEYGGQYHHEAYYPYHGMRQPLPYRYPGAASIPYYGGMFEYQQPRPQYSEMPKKRVTNKKQRHHKQK